jgi:hypothetical protein
VKKTPEEIAARKAQRDAEIAAEAAYLAAAPEFTPWPKIKRLNRDIVITEKIDGTNAAVVITETGIFAQSRTRMLSPHNDNAGFFGWVMENKDILTSLLGPGTHFGEWWGKGIQRSYGLDHKRFSLFNTLRWNTPEGSFALAAARAQGCEVYCVPVLWEGPWMVAPGRVVGYVENAESVNDDGSPKFLDKPAPPARRFMPEFELEFLRTEGSVAVPGQAAEGIVVFHRESGSLFKATVENDEKHKGEV